MKLTQLPNANELVQVRHKLQDYIDAAELGMITMQVGGNYPASYLVAVCKAPFIAECRAQISAIDRQLGELGVDID